LSKAIQIVIININRTRSFKY